MTLHGMLNGGALVLALGLAGCGTSSGGDDDETGETGTGDTGDSESAGEEDTGTSAAESGEETGDTTDSTDSTDSTDDTDETGGDACWDVCDGDPTGHSCCAADNGAGFFCGDDGECIEASGCEAVDCCVPGADGDAYCQTSFGDGSMCEVVDGDGRCSIPQACEQLDQADCQNAEGCMPIFLTDMYDDPGVGLCVGDTVQFFACIGATGCGDAETVFCDDEGGMWWSGDTCGPPDMTVCDPGPYSFCGG